MTTCQVLTEERWRRLLDNTLPAAEAAVLHEHLASHCSACEEFFEQLDEAGERQLRRIFSQADTAPRAESEPGAGDFRAVMRGVRHAGRQPIRMRWRRFLTAPGGGRMLWAGGAAAVVLAISAFLYLQPPLQTEKGAAPAAASIHLEFAVGDRQPQGQVVVTRGVIGERYSAESSLFLRFDVSARSYIYLVGYQEAGATRLLLPNSGGQSEPYAAGVHDVRPNGPNGQGGGIPLAGIQGHYVIVGVASSKPLDPDTQLIPIIRAAVNPATGLVDQAWMARFGGGIAIDTVYFDVQA